MFGAERGTSTTSSTFGFTGEQQDSETGQSYLRARYLNPESGRFLSADTVQPNAPGTQGYNLYSYVANNPTTWTDPSGHAAKGRTTPQRVVDIEMKAAGLIQVPQACFSTAWCAPHLLMGLGLVEMPNGLVQWSGMSVTTFTLIGCILDIKVVEGPGPSGMHIGDGDTCFKIFTQTQNVPDCHYQTADSCLPSPRDQEETSTACGQITALADAASRSAWENSKHLTASSGAAAEDCPPYPDFPYPNVAGEWNCGDIKNWALGRGWTLDPVPDPHKRIILRSPGGRYLIVIRLDQIPAPRWHLVDRQTSQDIDHTTGLPAPHKGPIGHRPLDPSGC